MRLVLVGPPGSGKGTQARLLADRLGLAYVGTGDRLRDAIRQGTPAGRAIEPLLRDGRFAPDPVVNDLVAELFRRDDRPDRFVTDGYPRTAAQAAAFDALLAQQFLRLDAVVSLAVPDDEVVRRIGGRRCCTDPACGTCFNLFARPPKVTGVCDRCGGPLAERADDREETVRRRLAEFHRHADPLLDHYRRQGLVRTVPATDAVEATYAAVTGVLGVGSR
jgi:adenylate kinase